MFPFCPEIPKPGFAFRNHERNVKLLESGCYLPKVKKTGTTVAGIVYRDGVVLGADTRATEETIVSDKNTKKIHYLQPNIYCCGAGIAGDTEMTTKIIRAELELHRLETKRIVRVVAANKLLKKHLFRYRGQVGAALVLGGIDSTGSHLYCIYPHGSSDKLPYTTMGSGALSSMGIFEAGWKPDLPECEAVNLVHRAILAGIYNDLGSGSFVDLCVIRKQSVQYVRRYEKAHIKKTYSRFICPEGTTPVLETKIFDLEVVHENVIRKERVGDDVQERKD